MARDFRQHFRAEEGAFIDQVQDWLQQASGEYRPVLTDFANPRQVYIAQTLVNQVDDVKLAHWGGYPRAEMQRLLFYPAYFEPTAADFNLALLAVAYPVKFMELHHRQVMGTLISEGLERTVFGDILRQEQRFQVVVKQELAPFIRQEITHVGKARVKFVPVDFAAVLTPDVDWEPLQTTVASLRLDAVVAAGFNYSRNRAKQTIEKGLVRVNWETIDRPDYELDEYDLLSVRHAGRLRLQAVGNRNRKDKLRVEMAIVKA